MILELFFDVLFNTIYSLINFIPASTLTFSGLLNDNFIRDFNLIINYAFYFLPASVVKSCFKLVMDYYLIRIVWSVILRIKSFIPAVSST